jgi:predicted metal-dependent hydrolase
MSIESLAKMTIPELIHERTLTERILKNAIRALSNCWPNDRLVIEDRISFLREQVRIINARIARLERKAR